MPRPLSDTIILCLLNLDSAFISLHPSATVLWEGDFNTVFDETIDSWPPKTRPGPSSELDNECFRLGRIDVWRCKDPDREEYAWSINKDSSLHSHTNYWSVSYDLTNYVTSVLIEPCIITDHIYKNRTISQKHSYRKLNNKWMFKGKY